MKAAIYARESDDDTNKAPPIEKQIERGMKWLQDNGYDISKVYQDNGYSGGDWKRPDWNQLVNDAKRHQFVMVWTWNQDRLARDTEQFLWFYRLVKESHVKVFSDTEGWINMETAGDRIKHTSLAMAAEAFRLITSEKVKRTYQNKSKEALQKGIKLIWGRKPITLDINRVLELRAEGLGYRAISKEFSCSYQTIRRLLQNTHADFKNENVSKNIELQNNPIK